MRQRIIKSLLLGFAICSMLISVCSLSACGEHVHHFGEYDIILAADCETAGKKMRTCSNCGYSEIEIIPAGHSWSEFKIEKSADCTEKGERKRVCSVCKYEDIEVIPATGHVWSEFEITIPAECDIPSKQTRICDVCKEEETEDIPALEHMWSEYDVIPSTCDKAGKMTRSCALCHKEESEEISMTDHTWSDYIETVPATCESVGVQTRTCTVCHKEESREISKLEHRWTDYTETLPAACEQKGEKSRSCELCKKVEKVEIPALQHEWAEEKIIKDPTCEETGLRSVICKLCGTSLSDDVIPAKGHIKASGFPLTAPTCESTGQNQNKCAVCGETYREIVPATGHNYSEEFTIDKNPTIDEEGVQSRHCTNYKCTSRIDIQSIPKLINEAYFRIYIVRGENQLVLPTTYNPMIQIVNEQGKTVATSFVFGDENKEHIFEKLLPFGTYTVSIVNALPAGFECDVYTISEQNGIYPYDTPEKYPTITMHLYSHLGEGKMSNGDKRATVLNDFSVTTVYGETVWISDLLKEKKLVWLNFYYNACYPCQSEAPEIIRIAKMFDVAVICFNSRDSLEDIKSGAKNIFKFPDNFYIVQDSGDVYGQLFGRYAYPLNVFIDSGGCVFESVTGSNYSSQFYNFIKNNLFETPEKKEEPVAETFIELAAILPDKQRYLYNVEATR